MTTLTVRVDDSLKKEASIIYEKAGLNLSTAINMFLKQTVIKQRFPLSIEYEIAKDYSYTYPEEFFNLFGSATEKIEEPKELPFDKEDLDL